MGWLGPVSAVIRRHGHARGFGKNFVNEVVKSKVPVLVEFGAEWCGPCKVVAPELKALANELEGKAKVVTVDIDRSPVLARELGVQAVPTFVVFDKGRPVNAHSGAIKQAQLRELVEPFLPVKPARSSPRKWRRCSRDGRSFWWIRANKPCSIASTSRKRFTCRSRISRIDLPSYTCCPQPLCFIADRENRRRSWPANSPNKECP